MATLSRPIITPLGLSKAISCSYCYDDHSFEMYYKVPAHVEINKGMDAFLIASLIPSMKLRQNIILEEPVLRSTLSSISKVQKTIHTWYPKLIDINVLSNHNIHNNSPKSKEVACFFSGGVDSMYTLLRHFEEITTLVFVHGFDMSLENTAKRKACTDMLADISKITGKKIIEVETNIRYFSDQFLNWDYHYHGSAMASVAMLLSETIGKIYVPSSLLVMEDGSDLIWGSHPQLDNLWSSDKIEIVYDDDDRRSRVEKIKYISNYEIAHDYLRVCWQDTDKYNCSYCEKCVRTITSLHIAGVSDMFKSFEEVSEEELAVRVSSKVIKGTAVLILNEENYRQMEDGILKSAVKKIIDEFQHANTVV